MANSMLFILGISLGLALGLPIGYIWGKITPKKPKAQPLTWDQMMARATRMPRNDPELARDVEHEIEMQFKEL